MGHGETEHGARTSAVAGGKRSLAAFLAIVVAAALAFVGLSMPMAAPAAAAGVVNNDCSFADAGTGTYASTLCWFDMSGVTAGTSQVTETLPGGYTAHFTLDVSGGPAAAHAFPTYSDAYLGNNGFYTGVAGKPALYQTGSGTTTTAALTDISLTDAAGDNVTGYSLVGADAETTDSGENIKWTSSNDIDLISDLGNSCDGGSGFTGTGTTSVECSASSSGTKTGTPIVASQAPSTFTQEMKGSGQQGVAFGIMISAVKLNKKVVNGYSGDNFGISIKDSDGNTVKNANTDGGSSATTDTQYVVVAANGSTYNFSEAATGGTTMSNYDASWSCTRNGDTDSSLPSGSAGDSNDVKVGIGDLVECTITNTAKPSSLQLTKHAGTPVDTNGDGLVDAGDTIQYTFDVKNTGDLTVHGLTVDDNKAGPVTCDATTLAPNASTTCTATNPYVITSADEAAKVVHNTATSTGVPDGTTDTVESNPDSTDTPVEAPNPALSLEKTVSPTHVSKDGQHEAYTFKITNTGNVTETNVGIEEGQFTGTGSMSDVTCEAGAASLAPGDSVTCTATYTTTQQDIDNGGFTNTATATGTAPDGSTTESDPSTAKTTATQDPSLQLVKSVTPSDELVVGQQETYSFVVTNTGNVTQSDVHITETGFTGSGDMSDITCPAAADSLAPGDQVTCTATYTVTQADVDQGLVTNTAHASGTPPSGGTTDSNNDSARVPAAQSPELKLTKTANPTTVTDAGQTVTYSFTVTNSGNVTETNVGVQETDFTGSGTVSDIACPSEAASLVPGASVTCTATYTTTQADIDNGTFTNTAVANGTAADGSTTTSNTDDAVVTAEQDPSLSLVKVATPTTVTEPGQTVTYHFLVINRGNVTMSNIAIDETAFSGTGTPSAVSCPSAPVQPGRATTCTATYDVTQADIDAGSVTNTAVATGTNPSGGTTHSNESSAIVNATQSPALTLIKSATPTTVTEPGQTVTYRFLVTNTGNVTETNISVDETAFSGSGTVSAISCPDTPLPPGKSIICTATYTTTQADINAGSITNTAVAHGTNPSGDTTDSNDSSAIVNATQSPELTLLKTADPTTVSGAGQTVTYSFLVTNTGNVTETDISIADTQFSGTGDTSPISCPNEADSLAPGDSVTCTTSYTTTQADVDAGEITNTATATGTNPDGTATDSNESTATVTVGQEPALKLAKTADPTSVNTAGDEVTYSFAVTNTGNVTETDIAVHEGSFTGSGSMSAISCPDAAASLAPGDTVTCTATYTTTQADIDQGSFTNTATATGTDPSGGTTTSNQADARVTANGSPELTLHKTADPTSITGPGENIAYTFEITNTGNVTVTDVNASETAFSGTGQMSDITCPAEAASLAPGGSVSCTATYKSTQADFDAGKITNTAVATGTGPGDKPVTSKPDSATVVAVGQTATLDLTKSADPTTVTGPGQTVRYTFKVTNTGNLTESNIAIDETAFSGSGDVSKISCASTTLAPGQSTTCTADYQTTQADIDAGSITNSAVATGTRPDGAAVKSNESSAIVSAPEAPGLTVKKTADPMVVTGAGQTITYSFEVTNTGNVTESHITIDESSFSGTGKLSPVSCPKDTLPPGASETCTATYTTTQADANAGRVKNTATANGDNPDGTHTKSDPSTAIVIVHPSGGTTPPPPPSSSPAPPPTPPPGAGVNTGGNPTGGDSLGWLIAGLVLGAVALAAMGESIRRRRRQ